jgi:hypothetical protein
MQEDWTTIGESKAGKNHLILSRKKAQRAQGCEMTNDGKGFAIRHLLILLSFGFSNQSFRLGI